MGRSSRMRSRSSASGSARSRMAWRKAASCAMDVVGSSSSSSSSSGLTASAYSASSSNSGSSNMPVGAGLSSTAGNRVFIRTGGFSASITKRNSAKRGAFTRLQRLRREQTIIKGCHFSGKLEKKIVKSCWKGDVVKDRRTEWDQLNDRLMSDMKSVARIASVGGRFDLLAHDFDQEWILDGSGHEPANADAHKTTDNSSGATGKGSSSDPSVVESQLQTLLLDVDRMALKASPSSPLSPSQSNTAAKATTITTTTTTTTTALSSPSLSSAFSSQTPIQIPVAPFERLTLQSAPSQSSDRETDHHSNNNNNNNNKNVENSKNNTPKNAFIQNVSIGNRTNDSAAPPQSAFSSTEYGTTSFDIL